MSALAGHTLTYPVRLRQLQIIWRFHLIPQTEVAVQPNIGFMKRGKGDGRDDLHPIPLKLDGGSSGEII